VQQTTLADRTTPYVHSAPEAAFGIESVATWNNTAQGSMRPGPWAWRQGDGPLHQGSIGVLVDNVTAHAVLTARTQEQWAVSSEISVDFHSRVPKGTELLSCTAALDHRSSGWGYSRGQVTTGTGELMATVGQRMRYFPGVPARFADNNEPMDAPSWRPRLDTLLTLTSRRSNSTELSLKAVAGMLNPLGVIHGGVGLCVSELAAQSAWANSPDHPGEPFHTSSLRISYLRPGRADGDLRLSVEIVHFSRSVALANVLMYNADGEAATQAFCTMHRSATHF
jgi:uncharacterized protein (TIGR00369 family)